MNQRVTRAKTVLSAIVHEARSENLTFMAGSIAYHAFVSLLPLLLLVLFVLSRVGSRELARGALFAIGGYLGPDVVDVLVRTAFNAARSGGLSAVGLVVLVWGTLRIFRGFDQAFSDIYETESVNTLPDQILDGVVVFGAIGLAIFLVSVLEDLIPLPSYGPVDIVLRPALSVVALTVAFLPMFYVFPDEDVTVREVVPGALVAGVGWTLLSTGFQYYVFVSQKQKWGVVGIVILFITWLYFAGFVLLLGAAVNAVLAGRSEDVSNIAWGRAEEDASVGDADFVPPLRELETADWEGDVRVVTDDADVTLPHPDRATVSVEAVDRPAFMGGSSERGRLVLKWKSDG